MSMAVATQTMTGAPPPRAAPQGTERAQAQERPASLPALTGLRFVAASLVVVAHLAGLWRTHTGLAGAWATRGPLPDLDPGTVAQRLLASGGLAVTLFFVLSGFILAHCYLGPDGRFRGSRRAFWAARFARLYPVYLLGLGLGAVPLLWWGQAASVFPQCARASASALPAALAGLAALQAWNVHSLGCLNAPAWSLSCEALFYALCPFLALPLGRLRPRGLLAASVLCCALMVGLPLAYLQARPDAGADWAHATWLGLLDYSPLAQLPDFVLGLLLGRLFALWGGRGGRGALLVGLGGLALVYGALVFPLGQLANAVAAPFLGALIYGLAAGQGLLCRTLARPAWGVLGESSYSLYILHWPLWLLVTHAAGVPAYGAARGSAAEWALCGAYAALVLALAVLCWRYVEQPARARLRARLAFGARRSAFGMTGRNDDQGHRSGPNAIAPNAIAPQQVSHCVPSETSPAQSQAPPTT